MSLTVWNNAIKETTSGEATVVDVVNTVTGWLKTDLVTYTDGMWEPMGRRVIWLFPDGWMFNVGTYFAPVFQHKDTLIEPGTNFPMPDYFNTEGWEFSPYINGWRNTGAETDIIDAERIVELVEAFTVEHGEPMLALPWEYMYYGYYLEQGEDEAADEFYVDEETGLNTKQLMLDMIKLVDSGKLTEQSPWEVKVGNDGDWLSEHCDFTRFVNLTRQIREKSIAILDLDQHCAGCSSGTEEYAVKENPKLEGKPTFRTWEQNSQTSYTGDGALLIEVRLYDQPPYIAEKRIKFLAEELGLYTGIYEEDWEPIQEFSYETPHLYYNPRNNI